jgi:hypothetical protein
MLETLIASAVALGLLAIFLLKHFLSALTLAAVGAALVAGGLAVGIPTGFVYHLRLRACLVRSGQLPPHWLLSPTSTHHMLPVKERSRVLAWFYAGAAGFLLIMLGCLLVALVGL